MIVWMPERIWEEVKNDPAVIKKLQEIEEYVSKRRFPNSFLEYDIVANFEASWQSTKLGEECVFLLYDTVKSPAYKREILIVFCTEYQWLENELHSETDLENIAMIYYQLLSFLYNDRFHDKEKHDYYIEKYIQLVESNPAYKFSERVYLKYFQYKAFKLREEVEMRGNAGDNVLILTNYYLKELKALRSAILQLPINYDYTENILNHKYMEELSIYTNEILLRYNFQCNPENSLMAAYLLTKDAESLQFKYGSVNVFLLEHYLYLFMIYFDQRAFGRAEVILRSAISTVNQAFSDPSQTLKALGHHNYNLVTRFMAVTHFFYKIVEILPNFSNTICTTLISPVDLPYIEGSIENVAYSGYNYLAYVRSSSHSHLLGTIAHVKSYISISKETYSSFNMYLANR